jgi:hypothetical protein
VKRKKIIAVSNHARVLWKLDFPLPRAPHQQQKNARNEHNGFAHQSAQPHARFVERSTMYIVCLWLFESILACMLTAFGRSIHSCFISPLPLNLTRSLLTAQPHFTIDFSHLPDSSEWKAFNFQFPAPGSNAPIWISENVLSPLTKRVQLFFNSAALRTNAGFRKWVPSTSVRDCDVSQSVRHQYCDLIFYCS